MDDSWIPTVAQDKRWEEPEFNPERALRPFAEFKWETGGPLYRAAEDYLQRYTTEAGMTSRRGALLHFLRWAMKSRVEVTDLEKRDATRYVSAMDRAGYKRSTMSLHVGAARTFCEHLIDGGAMQSNPFDRVTVKRAQGPRATPSIKLEPLEHCLRLIVGDFDHPEQGLKARRDFALMLTFLFTALRSVEVSRLRVFDFYREENGIKARVHGKTDEAEVHFPAIVVEAIGEYVRAFERARHRVLRPDDPLFPSLSPRDRMRSQDDQPLRPMRAASISNAVQERLLDAGIVGKRMKAHALRASAASQAINAGANIHEVKDLLRHLSLETTQRCIDEEMIRKRNVQDLLPYRVPAVPNAIRTLQPTSPDGPPTPSN